MDRQQSVKISKERFMYAVKRTGKSLENFHDDCSVSFGKMRSEDQKKYVNDTRQKALQEFRSLQRNLNKSKEMKYGILNYYCRCLDVAPEYITGEMSIDYSPEYEIMRFPYMAEDRVDPNGHIIPYYKESKTFAANSAIAEKALDFASSFESIGFYDNEASSVFFFDRSDFEDCKYELAEVMRSALQKYLSDRHYLKYDYQPDDSPEINIIG